MSSDQQKAHDALLEAEAWKQTASRWRKRALREGAPWRRKCAKFEEELDDVNERAAELQEKVDELEGELADAKAPLERRIKDLEATLEKERASSGKVLQEYGDIKRRMGKAGSLEALVVERDSLKERVAEFQHRLNESHHRETAALNRARMLEQDGMTNKERIVVEQVNPAKARIRVLATRLGVTPVSFAHYSDDDKLTEELDRRIANLVKELASAKNFDSNA